MESRPSPPPFPPCPAPDGGPPGGDGPAEEIGPPWPYLAVLALLTGLGYAFGEVAEEARRVVPGDVDDRLLNWVIAHRDGWPGLTRFFHAVTVLGNPEFAYPAVTLIALGLVVLHRRGVAGIRGADAIFWVGVALAGQILNHTLKIWFGRERPPLAVRLVHEESRSFPSGHSIFSAVFFCMAAALIVRTVPPVRRALRGGLIGACLLLAMLVAASRIWLGVHYLTDVVGGFLLGTAWGIAALTIRAYWRRHRRLRRRAGAP